jgi:uncharacterized protein YaaQ
LNVAEFAAWFGAHNDGDWVKKKGEYGWTPLHIGMKHKAPAAVIKLLVDACPEGVKKKGGDGFLHYGGTLLHIGIIHKAPAEAIKLVVEACPMLSRTRMATLRCTTGC